MLASGSVELRPLHVSNSPYPSLAEMGPTRAILRELSRGCAEYHVLAPYPGRPRHDVDGILELHTVPAGRGRTFMLTSAAAAPLIRRHRLNAIICQDPLLGGLTAIGAGRALGTPTLVELHTDLYFRLAADAHPARRALGRMALWTLRRATLVRSIGPVQSRLLVAHGVDAQRIRLVPYRVDTELFSPGAASGSQEPIVLTSVGRFVAQKGYLELLDVFAELARSTPLALRLVLAGGGPLEGALRARAAALGVADAVALRTWMSQLEVRDLLRETDIYLQPSAPGKGDWMPRTILEAMATALPVVATDVGGIPDVLVDGRNGRLVPARDPALLAGAVRELIEARERRAELGAAALATARSSYSWESSFASYRALLSEVVASGA